MLPVPYSPLREVDFFLFYFLFGVFREGPQTKCNEYLANILHVIVRYRLEVGVCHIFILVFDLNYASPFKCSF